MAEIEFVTSANLVYWKKYGHRLAESFVRYVDASVPLYLYHEASLESGIAAYGGFAGRVIPKDLIQNSPRIVQFLKKAKAHVQERMGFVPSSNPDERLADSRYDYRWDAVTFSKKGFALAHALRNTRSRFLFWVDADVVFRRNVPLGFLRHLLDGVEVAYFGRHPQHSETGFLGFDTSSKNTVKFAEVYASLWSNGHVFLFSDGWTDCHVFDWARRSGEKNGLRCRNLSSQLKGHVIATSPLGAYIDHQKGPRKQMGFSPERLP